MAHETDRYAPHPSQVEVAGIDVRSQRRVVWTWGTSDVPGGGYDYTELYVAPDENGDLRWWRQIIEDTVGNPGEPEKVSLRDALKAVEPCYRHPVRVDAGGSRRRGQRAHERALGRAVQHQSPCP